MPQTESNYEIMKRQARERFAKSYMSRVGEIFALREDADYYYIELVARLHRLRKSDALAEVLEDGCWKEADVEPAMILYDALSRDHAPLRSSGEWVSLRSLSSLAGGFVTDESSFFRRSLDRMAGQGDRVRTAAKKLGGVPDGKGDLSFRFNLLPFQPVRLSIWEADEEFPSSVQICFDKTVGDSLRYETLWYAAGYLFTRLLQEAGL